MEKNALMIELISEQAETVTYAFWLADQTDKQKAPTISMARSALTLNDDQDVTVAALRLYETGQMTVESKAETDANTVLFFAIQACIAILKAYQEKGHLPEGMLMVDQTVKGKLLANEVIAQELKENQMI